jgi:hypothetical protein
MSYLSAQGQINTTSFQIPVSIGGAGSGVADELYNSGTFVFPAGFYLVSFTTAIAGTTLTSGYIEFQVGGVDVGQIQIFSAGKYTLTAPVYLSSTDDIVVNASATGGSAWTSSASTLFLIRMP